MEPHAQCPAGGTLLPGLACCGLPRQGVGIHSLFGDKLWLKLDTRETVPNVGNAMILRELDRNKQAVIEKHASIFRPHLWFCCGQMGAGRDMPEVMFQCFLFLPHPLTRAPVSSITTIQCLSEKSPISVIYASACYPIPVHLFSRVDILA